jgi:hypothetical protein
MNFAPGGTTVLRVAFLAPLHNLYGEIALQQYKVLLCSKTMQAGQYACFPPTQSYRYHSVLFDQQRMKLIKITPTDILNHDFSNTVLAVFHDQGSAVAVPTSGECLRRYEFVPLTRTPPIVTHGMFDFTGSAMDCVK